MLSLYKEPFLSGLPQNGVIADGFSAEAAQAERRVDRRRRILKGGKIIWGKCKSVVDCTVRNVSETGAMILVVPLAVPAEFDLLLDGATRRCLVIWRRPDRVGVKFIATAHTAK